MLAIIPPDEINEKLFDIQSKFVMKNKNSILVPKEEFHIPLVPLGTIESPKRLNLIYEVSIMFCLFFYDFKIMEKVANNNSNFLVSLGGVSCSPKWSKMREVQFEKNTTNFLKLLVTQFNI